MAEAEKNQVFFDAFRCGESDNRTAKLGKGFDRMLSVVVVPRNVVVVQKRKELVTVLLESLLAPQCVFALPCCILKLFVELLDLSLMLSEKVMFQTSSVDRFHNRYRSQPWGAEVGRIN